MEERSQEFPEPAPQIPKGELWLALLMPPLGPFALVLIIHLMNHAAGGAAGFMVPLSMLTQLGLVIGFSFRFNDALSKRYRGPSVAILFLAYLLGQFAVCLSLWIVFIQTVRWFDP